ncbi:6-pyruvoyl tetrahydropterin synthase family protein [Paraburkholderia sp. BR14427]|uniref:6-pyruvoyl trahydropterin synthase family protein n=1 Tax=unclassified Paraburkholderia TaxID=2615204 RepID=UPI0034CE5A49
MEQFRQGCLRQKCLVASATNCGSALLNKALCNWVEDHWDHRMLLWIEDPFYAGLRDLDPSVVGMPFNPTAENLAQWLVTKLGPEILQETGVRLVEVRVEETRKCSVTYRL